MSNLLTERVIDIDNIETLMELFGSFDQNVKFIEGLGTGCCREPSFALSGS